MGVVIPNNIIEKHNALKAKHAPNSVYMSYIKTKDAVYENDKLISEQDGSVLFIKHPTREQQIALLDLMMSQKIAKAHDYLIQYCTIDEESDVRLKDVSKTTEEINRIYLGHVMQLKNEDIIDWYLGEVKKN
jgi:hypothetical protein